VKHPGRSWAASRNGARPETIAGKGRNPATAPVRPAARDDRRRRHERLEEEARRAGQGPVDERLSPAPRSDAPATPRIPGVGRPLPHLLRRHYERSLGHDLSGVRIHDDHAAARQAETLGARAFTVGRDIAIGGGYDPGKAEGRQLLDHEVAHVVQQDMAGGGRTVQCNGPRSGGIGHTPPDGPFTTIEGTGAEDEHVLFPRDSADLDSRHNTSIQRLLGTPSGPMTVHVHGYASQEGDAEYNRNLSAHRAVAVMQYIEGLLPEGSRVIAYAHGETDVFGGLGANRRVGIDIVTEGGSMAGETGTGDFSPGVAGFGRFSLGLDLDLRLDPDIVPLLPPTGIGPILPRPPAIDDRIMRPVPPLPGTGFDAGAFAPLHSARGIPMTELDARSYENHFTTWRDRYILWGLSPERAAWLAQLGTESAAETQLSIEHPTRTEELDRMMGTEPTIVPVFNDAMMRWLFEQMR